MFASQLACQGMCKQVDIIRVFGVSKNSIKRSVKKSGSDLASLDEPDGPSNPRAEGTAPESAARTPCRKLGETGTHRRSSLDHASVPLDSTSRPDVPAQLHR